MTQHSRAHSRAHSRTVRLLASASVALVLPLAAPAVAEARPARPTTVTATAAVANADVGDRVTVTGAARPAKASRGRKVVVQAKVAGTWRPVGRATVRRGGTYKLVAKVAGVDRVSYRAVVARTASKAFRVTGWDWFTASDLSWGRKVESHSTWWYNATSGETLNGRTGDITGDILGVEDAWARYTTGRACDRVAGHFGVVDGSEPGRSVRLSVAADGTERWSGTFSLGRSEQVDVAVGRALYVDVHLPGIWREVVSGAQDLRFHCSRAMR